jgi:hypothetical protein
MRFEFDGSSLCIGVRDFEMRRIAVLPAYQKALQTLPAINAKVNAA